MKKLLLIILFIGLVSAQNNTIFIQSNLISNQLNQIDIYMLEDGITDVSVRYYNITDFSINIINFSMINSSHYRSNIYINNKENNKIEGFYIEIVSTRNTTTIHTIKNLQVNNMNFFQYIDSKLRDYYLWLSLGFLFILFIIFIITSERIVRNK